MVFQFPSTPRPTHSAITIMAAAPLGTFGGTNYATPTESHAEIRPVYLPGLDKQPAPLRYILQIVCIEDD